MFYEKLNFTCILARTVVEEVNIYHLQRALWRHYYTNTDAIVFVIDSNDRERISECKDHLWALLQEEELQQCTLLVLANKQDLEGAMTTDEVREKLELDSLKFQNKKICKFTCTSYFLVLILYIYIVCYRYSRLMCHQKRGSV